MNAVQLKLVAVRERRKELLKSSGQAGVKLHFEKPGFPPDKGRFSEFEPRLGPYTCRLKRLLNCYAERGNDVGIEVVGRRKNNHHARLQLRSPAEKCRLGKKGDQNASVHEDRHNDRWCDI